MKKTTATKRQIDPELRELVQMMEMEDRRDEMLRLENQRIEVARAQRQQQPTNFGNVTGGWIDTTR